MLTLHSELGKPIWVLDIYLHTWSELDVGEEYLNNYIDLPSIVRAVLGQHNLVSLTVDEQSTEISNENKIKSWYYVYYSIWYANNQKKEIENKLYPLSTMYKNKTRR